MHNPPPPVIAIDGPAASGKGTIAAQVARRLGFHYLDSGRLYRAAALAAQQAGLAPQDPQDHPQIATLLQNLAAAPPRLRRLAASPEATLPQTGQLASRLAAFAPLRRLLLPLQRAWLAPPGLVADGRDMGSVVFPDAALKVFLTADVQIRAVRRQAQLAARGINATITATRADLQRRDQQDTQRAAAPLRPCADSLHLDSTRQSIDDIAQTVIRAYRAAAFHPSTTEHSKPS